MNSVCIQRPNEARIIERDEPAPRPGEAKIAVRAVGICGSDIGAYQGTNPLVSYPRVIGHEIAGEIIEIPPNASGLSAGDHVVVDPYLYCGSCYPCSIGRTNCCENLRVLGVHVDGGMTEHFCHPKDMLVKLPNDLPWSLAPLAEPLTIALHGLHRAKVKAGEHVTIIGAGTIGILMAMAARNYGAEPILIDIVAERLRMASSFGIKNIVDSSAEEPEAAVSRYTNRRMSEVVIEASGANSAIAMTLKLVSNAGRIVLTGWPKKETLIPTDMITKKEIDIVGARTSAREFDEAVRLIHEGKIDVSRLLTRTVGVSEAADAIGAIASCPGDFLKVNVLFDR